MVSSIQDQSYSDLYSFPDNQSVFLLKFFKKLRKQKITLIGGKREFKPKIIPANLWGVEKSEINDSFDF